jgi:hypothetical protein
MEKLTMYFDSYGPFRIAKSPDSKITSAQLTFWKEVRDKSSYYDHKKNALEESFGCYVFGIEWGKTLTPWDVGQTVAETGFKGEIFQRHKLDIYNDVAEKRNGNPIVFLFPLLTPEGYLSKSRSAFNKSLVTWTERILFGFAITKNQDCKNKHSTMFLRKRTINGVMGPPVPGRPERMASQAKRLLFRAV